MTTEDAILAQNIVRFLKDEKNLDAWKDAVGGLDLINRRLKWKIITDVDPKAKQLEEELTQSINKLFKEFERQFGVRPLFIPIDQSWMDEQNFSRLEDIGYNIRRDGEIVYLYDLGK